MDYCAEHPEEMDKIAKIKSQVAEVKGVMMENIEQVCWSYLVCKGYAGLLDDKQVIATMFLHM